jgi:Helix-turn-helix domain
VSPTARLRVAQRGWAGAGDADALRVALSKSLAGRRRAAGMTQPKLAEKLGVSLTTVGHAETGRVWQARDFWDRAGRGLGGDGCLLRMYDQYKAAEAAGHAGPEEAAGAAREDAPPALPVLPASVTITTDGVSIIWRDGTETLATPPGCQGADGARK